MLVPDERNCMVDAGSQSKLIDKLQTLTPRHYASPTVFFGSRARGDHHPKNDMISKLSLQSKLTWKLLKETLICKGTTDTASCSPRQIAKPAYASYDFLDEILCLEMLRTRNDSAYIYDDDAGRQLVERIVDSYILEFRNLLDHLSERYSGTPFSREMN